LDADADYADVKRALSNPNLPAYVSYVIHSHAGFDAVHSDDQTTIVVRTSDGKIVLGKPPKLDVGSNGDYNTDVVRRGPFDVSCYTPESASLTTFEAHPAEAIALHSVCAKGDGNRHDNDTEFRVLYADPATHRPIAVIGHTAEKYITADLDERFTVADAFVVPSRFAIKIAGSGPMFWLNVDATQTYSGYRFLARQPR
jgi:hypothetical protein